MSAGSRVVLTEREWRWWFGVAPPEARRLAAVQQALLAAGLDPCPDTVIGMSRTVLAGGAAAARLRALADLWERASAPGAGGAAGWPVAPAEATEVEQGWPLCYPSTEPCTRRASGPTRGRRPGRYGRS